MKKILFTLGLAAAAMSMTSCEFLNAQGDEFTACMGIDSTSDMISGIINAGFDEQNCPVFQNEYDKEIANEGKLLSVEEVKRNAANGGDFAMSLALNKTGIQKLFDASVTWTDQFPVTIDIGGCDTKGNLIDDIFGVSGISVDNCLSFGINVKGYRATLGVPITDEIKMPDEHKDQYRTAIYADLSKAQIIKLCTDTSCLDKLAASMLSSGITTALSMAGVLSKVHMFDIAAWEVGNNNVMMFAGSPRVHVDRATGYEAVEFGMYSNLVDSPDYSINIARDMPQEAEVGLHIHPELIRKLIARMMTEHKGNDEANDTYITRSVNLDVKENATTTRQGSFHVTMADLSEYPNDRLYACSADWRDYFTFGFRLWSTEQFCGYMDVLAGMQMEISDNLFSISAGNIHGGKSAGAMSLANGALNMLTTSDFFKSVLSYANFTVNFNEMTVTDKKSGGLRKAPMGVFDFKVSGTGLNLYLNFVDL